MDINEILEYNGLSVEILRSFSYKSRLGMSLKRTLRHFDKDELISEIYSYADWLDGLNISSQINLDFRIKCYDSIDLKYERYYPDRSVKKVFNDILGMRAFCDDYDSLISYNGNEFIVADMSKGKSIDDGYRGIHIYYDIDNYHYPIEIQFNTLLDRQMNNWLHDYLYKRDYPVDYGRRLREMYEQGYIRNVNDFERVLYNDLLGSEKQK